MNKRNTVLTQFKRTMNREGEFVSTYTGGREFKAFFRTRNDNGSQKESIIMYYDVNAPMRPGMLVVYGHGVFLALNKETIGNDVYYKSTLVKCNGVFSDNSGCETLNIPFYSGSMKSGLPTGNQTISVINGNIELIMEENSLTKKIRINDTFNEFGRTFKVVNQYIVDGIVHLLADVISDQKAKLNYCVLIDGLPKVVVPGKTTKLTATAYVNGEMTTGATFEWASSDESIAMMDGKGIMTPVNNGYVNITAKWVEKDIVGETGAVRVGGDGNERWEMRVVGIEEIRNTYRRTYVVETKLNGAECHLDGVDYEIITPDGLSFAYEHFNYDTNQLTLCVDDERMIGKTFTIRAYKESIGLSSTLDVNIISTKF